jgi:hypothetical protein
MNKDELQAELKKMSLPQIRWFASRVALRCLPRMARQVSDINSWKANKEKHIFNLFRAVNMSFLVAKNDKKPYNFSVVEIIRNNSWEAYNVIISGKDAKYSAGSAAIAAAYAADTAVLTSVEDAAYAAATVEESRDHAAADDALTDIALLKATKAIPAWVDIWYGKPPYWHKQSEQNLLEGLDKFGLGFWKKQYLAWVEGIFDVKAMKRAFDIPQEIYDADIYAMVAYLQERTDKKMHPWL